MYLPKKIVVDKNSPINFNSISEALNFIKTIREKKEISKNELIEIFIKEGIYKEKIEIILDNVLLTGEDVDKTIITESFGAKDVLDDGSKRGTFRTATVRTLGKDITLKNLTIKNEAGSGVNAGQAVAFYADGNIIVENCKFLAHQDTIFTAPLPPTNIDGTTTGMGPRGDFKRTPTKVYFKNCFIEGDIDFIFGGAAALFENCKIFSHEIALEDDSKIHGYITAASTPEKQKFGYLFLNCTLESNCPENTVYLGRPWRDNAKTVFANCSFGKHIRSELWHDWNKPNAQRKSFYAVGNCYFENKKINQVKWSHILNNTETEKYIQLFLKFFHDFQV